MTQKKGVPNIFRDISKTNQDTDLKIIWLLAWGLCVNMSKLQNFNCRRNKVIVLFPKLPQKWKFLANLAMYGSMNRSKFTQIGIISKCRPNLVHTLNKCWIRWSRFCIYCHNDCLPLRNAHRPEQSFWCCVGKVL